MLRFLKKKKGLGWQLLKALFMLILQGAGIALLLWFGTSFFGWKGEGAGWLLVFFIFLSPLIYIGNVVFLWSTR
ncbi:hypothetical protein [Bacillus sp. REN3]|uniref:hypothetical protein n=1 Tax=Bacillus sp. REN3 TaxID=2802440 RepID=UPI001AEE73A4|nr:hypothetical protein [Bacillus sp. REN3]